MKPRRKIVYHVRVFHAIIVKDEVQRFFNVWHLNFDSVSRHAVQLPLIWMTLNDFNYSFFHWHTHAKKVPNVHSGAILKFRAKKYYFYFFIYFHAMVNDESSTF